MSCYICLDDGRRCQVIASECRWRACLRPGHHTIRSSAGASGCSSRTDPVLSCVRWTDLGCPAAPPVATLDQVHRTGIAPKFAWRIRRPTRGMIRCVCGCGVLFPRWMVYAWQEATGV